MLANVERATKSPLNASRWCLSLSCGHEKWVTSKSKPKTQFVVCDPCSEGELRQAATGRRSKKA